MLYISPNHPGRERLLNPGGPAPPIEDHGRRLATCPRGRDEELRVSLDEFEGKQFVSLRVWSKGSDGRHYPTRKGCSVRIRELAEVSAALAGLAEELGVEAPEPRKDRRLESTREMAVWARPSHGISSSPRQIGELPPPDEEFDEFG